MVGEGAERFVYVIGQDNKVARTQVKVGIRDRGNLEITQGLRAGQRVVAQASSR